eukprot:266509-Amphidinium_carterae.1
MAGQSTIHAVEAHYARKMAATLRRRREVRLLKCSLHQPHLILMFCTTSASVAASANACLQEKVHGGKTSGTRGQLHAYLYWEQALHQMRSEAYSQSCGMPQKCSLALNRTLTSCAWPVACKSVAHASFLGNLMLPTAPVCRDPKNKDGLDMMRK